MGTAEAELNALLDESSGSHVVGIAAGRAAAILDVVRRGPLARSELCLLAGEAALAQSSPKTVAYWDYAEQLVLASAEAGVWETCERILSVIDARFPVSWRADILKGRVFEARGAWAAAMALYSRIVERDAVKGAPAYKRQVAVLKSTRKVDEAIALLNYYLSIFGVDADAWAELCSLCLGRGRFSHALYAANELVVLQPENYAAHIVVANVYMTIGGHDNYLAARRHYAASIARRRFHNLLALYGMWTAASRLKASDRWPESTDRDEEGEEFNVSKQRMRNDRIIAWARDAIISVYKSPQRLALSDDGQDALIVMAALAS
jgi:tetratricopeptide (TPR) repeat protein